MFGTTLKEEDYLDFIEDHGLVDTVHSRNFITYTLYAHRVHQYVYQALEGLFLYHVDVASYHEVDLDDVRHTDLIMVPYSPPAPPKTIDGLYVAPPPVLLQMHEDLLACIACGPTATPAKILDFLKSTKTKRYQNPLAPDLMTHFVMYQGEGWFVKKNCAKPYSILSLLKCICNSKIFLDRVLTHGWNLMYEQDHRMYELHTSKNGKTLIL